MTSINASANQSVNARVNRFDALPTGSKVGAFFDVDNTIMRGASIYHLARGLFSRKILSAGDLRNYALAQGKFLIAGSENLADMARITESALSFVAGRDVEEVKALADEIYHEIMEAKIWPGTVELAQSHLTAGHQVWLVSAAPIELAELIASKLGLTGAVATISQIVDGKYTGKLVSEPMHGAQKAQAVARLADENGLDLKNCFAYSDSKNDIPLLSEVGHPTVVNPDSELRAYAKLKNWPIYDYRRERLIKRYAIPAGTTAVALIGAGAGMALANRRKNKKLSE